MNKPFQKPSVKKPPHVKKFIPWIYTSSCGAANTQLFECLFTGVQDLPSGPPRLSGRPAFGRPPSEASEVPREGPATPVNSIHSWVFSVTALGAVVSRKKLCFNHSNVALNSLWRIPYEESVTSWSYKSNFIWNVIAKVLLQSLQLCGLTECERFSSSF